MRDGSSACGKVNGGCEGYVPDSDQGPEIKSTLN